jgi:hypothetical protein
MMMSIFAPSAENVLGVNLPTPTFIEIPVSVFNPLTLTTSLRDHHDHS